MAGLYHDVDMSELGRSSEGGSGVSGTYDSNGVNPTQATSGTEPIPGAGPLLEEADESEVFKQIHKTVIAQETLAKNRAAASRHWGRVLRGIPFSTLVKVEDKGEWKAMLPPGVDDASQPIPNKAADLVGRITAQVVVDPFLPDPKPQNDSERARQAADLGKKFLRRDGDESGTNDAEVVRQSVDTAQVHASGFAHLWCDLEGGGWRPKRIKAHPLAVDANNPLFGPDGQPTSDYILRHVTADGQFTEDPSQADRQWMPAFRVDLLHDAHVRTVPETAPVHKANAVILLMVAPLSDAKRRFPMLRELGDEETRILCDWRPKRAKELVPEALQGRFHSQESDRKDKKQSVSDETLIFWYHKYCVSGVDYPDGAEIAVNGGKEGTVLKRATLRDDVEVHDAGGDEEEEQQAPPTMPDMQPALQQTIDTVEATGVGMQAPAPPAPPVAKKKPIVRSIPVAQCMALHDTEGRDPNGKRPIERFGAANEARAQLYGAILEDADRRLHPNVFLSGTSTVQGWQLTQRTGDPIILDVPGEEPSYEQFADLPTFSEKIIEKLDRDMEAAAGLSEGMATGLEGSTSGTSGVAKEAVIRQAKVALAEQYQNTVQFVKRFWRLKLELAQCKLTVPQQVEYSGEDGAYKQRWWTGADLVGVGDVRILAGSGTMMSPAEKQQHLMGQQQLGWVTPDEAAEAGRSTAADDLGLQPSRHKELIARQLAEWSDGPPQGWTPAMPAMDPATGGPVIDPLTGQPAMQPPSWSPFEARPTDEDPEVARQYYLALRDFIPTTDYTKHPPEWRTLVDARYDQARRAAGVATMAEQQMAQQQAAQQQLQAESDKQAGQSADKDADRAFKGEQADADRQMQRSENAQDRALAVATQPPQKAA